jgi:hypothetical protein
MREGTLVGERQAEVGPGFAGHVQETRPHPSPLPIRRDHGQLKARACVPCYLGSVFT